MKAQEQRFRFFWINVNVLLFLGYAIFGLGSFFWPTVLNNLWFFLLHLGTLAINLLIIYGLLKKRFQINYVVAMVSSLMIVHLLIFTFVPLGMELAYLGPSRAFYSFFLFLLSLLIEERSLFYALIMFNLTMVLIHMINLYYFTRKNISALFKSQAISY